MRSWQAGVALLLLVVLGAVGCAGPVMLVRRPTGRTVAVIEQGDLRKTASGVDEEASVSLLEDSGALGRIERRTVAQWARLALDGSRSASSGESSGTVEDHYRLRAGRYLVMLRGVAVGTASGDWTSVPALSVGVRIARADSSQPLVEQAWDVPGRLTPLADGSRLVWVTAAEASSVTLTVPSDGTYRVTGQFHLATTEPSATGSLSLEGAFRIAVETPQHQARRTADATALKHDLLALWTAVSPYGGDRSELEQAAERLADGFFVEGVDYVEALIAPDQRRVCMEHARLVHEWFERRAAQDPMLVTWFRLTRIRREIPLFWQSSNLVTPNLDVPVEQWLRDGTGIVIEPKPTSDDRLVGRALPVRSFSVWRGLVVVQEPHGAASPVAAPAEHASYGGGG